MNHKTDMQAVLTAEQREAIQECIDYLTPAAKDFSDLGMPGMGDSKHARCIRTLRVLLAGQAAGVPTMAEANAAIAAEFANDPVGAVRAHAAFTKLLAAAPASVSAPAPDREQATLCEDGGKCGIGGYCGQCEKVRAASEPEQPSAPDYTDCCDTPSLCSSVRRCTAQDAPRARRAACPHGVDDGACKQCYGEAVRGKQGTALLHAAADECMSPDQRNLFDSLGAHDADVYARLFRCVAKRIDASAPTLSGGDGEVAVRAKTVHRRIDALCEAANTAGADYFDASTSMLIATRDLLTALGFPHRMVAPQPQAAEPKGMTEEQRKSLEHAIWNFDRNRFVEDARNLRALLANGE